MDLRRAFALSAYALVLTGILSLAIAEGNPLIIAGASALSLLGYHQAERLGRPIGRLLTNLLVFTALLLTPADFFMITGDAVITLAHFLLVVQIVKLFGPKAARDYLQLFMISLMHLGVSAVLTVELAFASAFLVYMIVGTWTLVLFLLVRELEERAPGAPATIRSGRNLLSGTAVLSLGTLALTVVFFFAFPRFSAVLFDIQRHQHTQGLTGFTENISLKDLSKIKKNDEVVMRVQIEDYGQRFPAEPKWRGLSFDRYEDGRWRRSWHRPAFQPPVLSPHIETSAESLPGGGKRFNFRRRSGTPQPRDATASYVVFLAPLGLDSKAIFGVPDVDSVEFLSQDRPLHVVVDAGDSVIGVALPPSDVMYRMRSTPRRRDLARTAPIATPERAGGADYLELPPGPLGERLATLARGVIERASAATPYDQCVALERWLQSDFKYTLDLENLEQPGPGVDPIEHFLFKTKEGHCELSATAFVLMCRAIGFPARLVNGFQTGQWNDIGNYFQVRQAEAHAWAEVAFAGDAGWVDFDPTPWSTDQASGVLTALEKMRDYLRLRWLKYVISYTLSDQLTFADRVRQRFEQFRKDFREAMLALKKKLEFMRVGSLKLAQILFLGSGVLAALIATVWTLIGRARRERRLAGARGRGPPRRVPFFEELLRILARRGFKRQPNETPREFTARVARDGGPTLAGCPVVSEAFYRVRFGDVELAPTERAEVDAVLVSLGARGGGPRAPRASRSPAKSA